MQSFHNNVLTCASGYLLLLASVISGSQSLLFHLLLYIIPVSEKM